VHWLIFLVSDDAVNSGHAEPDPHVEEDILKTSKLSADAKEFYPRNFNSEQLQDPCSSSLQSEEVRFPDAIFVNHFNE
jgi:hypothetical protein